MRNDDPTKFERADPNALAPFDPRTKVCTMNCGPTVGDTRSPEERRFLCSDCVTVPVPSRNRANELFSALLEFHNAFCNRGETTSLRVWNERMKAADENAVAVLNAAPQSEQTHVRVPVELLRSLEFESGGYCPVCHGWEHTKGQGCERKVHGKNCWLNDMLRAATGKESEHGK